MTSDECYWLVTFLDGSKESVWGRLRINDGALWITKFAPYSTRVEEQVAYPLTALRKWERKS